MEANAIPTTMPHSLAMSSSLAAPHEYLVCQLGQEEYGIDILKVQEIHKCESVTSIANAPDYFKGVINLRGQIVPILDMRTKFKLQPSAKLQFDVVIILNVFSRLVGLAVDSVTDVTSLSADQILEVPRMSAAIDISFLNGIGSKDNRMLLLLDIDKFMSSEEIGISGNWIA